VTLALVAVAVGVRRLLRCFEPGTAAVDMAELTPVQLGYLRNGPGPAVSRRPWRACGCVGWSASRAIRVDLRGPAGVRLSSTRS